MGNEFDLTEEERAELLPSGRQPTVNNRVGWAKTYMVKAGLLEKTRRGYYKITQRGKDVLSDNPKTVNVKFLEQFEEFVEFRTATLTDTVDPTNGSSKQNGPALTSTPEETLEKAFQGLKAELADELLQTVKEGSPRAIALKSPNKSLI